DDVPGVPDWRSPEFADDGLLGGPGRAGVLTQALDLVERLRVRRAGQGRRRPGAELRSVLQDEGSHLAPVREGRRGAVRWRRLVVARLRARREWLRDDGGTVISAQLQDLCRDGVADLDAV